ncbi:MAG TPA: type II toxin-antitoxin system HipA family toxin [Candidatus Binatia bacterium]|jgi:serine/threonine-protein kinase HipA|nr:type II toxin-antitoxin system HipA family toxin [Candidatus Binatia bacterium]
MTRTLDVYLQTRLTGHLVHTAAGRLRFTYALEWLRGATPNPLSQSLPLREDPFEHAKCRPFFAGLLPDAGQRSAVARNVGVTVGNDFALLEAIGGDCAGAITFLPSGAPPPPTPTPLDYRLLPPAELAHLLRELPQRPLMAGTAEVRLSLAGAQGKVPVLQRDGETYLPLHGAPSSHILKPAIEHFEGTVPNEAFCLLLARQVGLHAVDVTIGSAEDQQYLVVTRYDRTRSESGVLERLHQEDFCQALAVPPEQKYQAEGGPSIAQCFGLVRSCAARPVVDVLRLLDFVIFNVLIGNNDAHAKNFSLIYGPTGVELAPLYDALCTLAYPRLSTRFAMKIGNKPDLESIRSSHWERFARDCGLAAPQVRRRVVELASSLPPGADEARARLAFPDTPIVDRIVDTIQHRCDLAKLALG